MTLLISKNSREHFYIACKGHDAEDGDKLFLLKLREVGSLIEWLKEHGISGINAHNSEGVTAFDYYGLAVVDHNGEKHTGLVVFN